MQNIVVFEKQNQIVPIPVSPMHWIYLKLLKTLTEPEWQQFMRVLDAMKPGLVAEAAAEAQQPEGD